jgi:tetratricopeptide (TPR) repeat protein
VEVAEQGSRQAVKTHHSFSLRGLAAGVLAFIGFAATPLSQAQVQPGSATPQVEINTSPTDAQAEAALRTGVDLTRRGQFAEAIPHFLAAHGHVQDEFVADFNLALCYIGTSDFPRAIQTLTAMHSEGKASANVENLLAQAYIGNGQSEDAFAALQRAAQLTPTDEKLYVFVSDACADRQDSALGLRVVDLGLQHLPKSARLHYQRANFLAALDHLDDAVADFDLAASLDPHSEVAFDAAAQKNFLEGNLPAAIQAAREAVQEHHANYLTLAILGDALLRTGASPGQPEFAEAESALKECVAVRPNYARALIALGYLLLLDDKPAEALPYLEKGRHLDSRNPAVYRHLARVYKKLGQPKQAQEMLAILADLNAQEVQKINSAPGERKAIPGRDHTYP